MHFLLFALLAHTPSMAAEMASDRGSCHGTLPGYGDYYASTYQYVFLDEGRIESEDHSFDFGGFLSGMENAVRAGFDDQFVVYRKGARELAVPFREGAGLLFRDFSDTPGHPPSTWIRLCDY